MHVAIDYDQTYSLCPDHWDKALGMLKALGHTICIVTRRYMTEEDLIEDEGRIARGEHTSEESPIIRSKFCVFYTQGVAKKEFIESLGINIDVWIEDDPRSVYESL